MVLLSCVRVGTVEAEARRRAGEVVREREHRRSLRGTRRKFGSPTLFEGSEEGRGDGSCSTADGGGTRHDDASGSGNGVGSGFASDHVGAFVHRGSEGQHRVLALFDLSVRLDGGRDGTSHGGRALEVRVRSMRRG